MQTNRKNGIKKVVDVLMTVLLLCLMAYQVTGETLHEFGGISMTVLLIVHHILNFKWYQSLFKGRYNAYRIVTVAVNTLLLASIALTALCGMAMSSHAVPFLYGMFPVSFARRFHLAMSFRSFILMGLHLGLHIPAMAAGIKWNGKIKTAVAAVAAVISGVGFWIFIKNGIPDYIFFRTPFAFFDYEKATVLVFLENLAILIAFAFLGAEIAALIKAAHAKNGDKKTRTLFSACLVLLSLLFKKDKAQFAALMYRRQKRDFAVVGRSAPADSNGRERGARRYAVDLGGFEGSDGSFKRRRRIYPS